MWLTRSDTFHDAHGVGRPRSSGDTALRIDRVLRIACSNGSTAIGTSTQGWLQHGTGQSPRCHGNERNSLASMTSTREPKCSGHEIVRGPLHPPRPEGFGRETGWRVGGEHGAVVAQEP